MTAKPITETLSPHLFWDVDTNGMDWDTYPSFIIPRVLEYGMMDDWKAVRSYYGLDKIVEVCKSLRTLDPVALEYIAGISHTDKKDYRCYHFAQSHPTLWNS